MASGGITGKALSLEALFDGRVTYAIEYYQREYAWGPDEVCTLITDLVSEFERTSGSRRSRWAPPVQYFLGPFVYADEDRDRRFLVDGQQRFTTLHLIFLHLLRMAPDDTRPKTRHRLTNAVVAGYDGEQPRFRLDIDERRRAMNALLNGQAFEPRLGDSLTVQNLWRRSEQIREDLAQRIQSDQHARFVDWLLDNVVMVGIEATDRDSGFRIFSQILTAEPAAASWGRCGGHAGRCHGTSGATSWCWSWANGCGQDGCARSSHRRSPRCARRAARCDAPTAVPDPIGALDVAELGRPSTDEAHHRHDLTGRLPNRQLRDGRMPRPPAQRHRGAARPRSWAAVRPALAPRGRR
jgi:uncharacterized protein DUF262